MANCCPPDACPCRSHTLHVSPSWSPTAPGATVPAATAHTKAAILPTAVLPARSASAAAAILSAAAAVLTPPTPSTTLLSAILLSAAALLPAAAPLATGHAHAAEPGPASPGFLRQTRMYYHSHQDALSVPQHACTSCSHRAQIAPAFGAIPTVKDSAWTPRCKPSKWRDA